jgi:glyoxylase-like metal-dependent hydrolase (beta-lactamase superfamily II)
LRKENVLPSLNWKLLTKKRGSSTQGLPPDKEDLAWVTNTVTLVSGERDAILVDTFLSVQHSKELMDWIAESGKNLTTIYVTHAHGDHFFGLKLSSLQLLAPSLPERGATVQGSTPSGGQC